VAVSPAASSAGLPASVVVPAGAEAFRQRIRGFIAGSVIPVEQEAFVSGVDDALRIRLQDAARAAGVLAPQAPAEFGGGGEDSAGDLDFGWGGVGGCGECRCECCC